MTCKKRHGGLPKATCSTTRTLCSADSPCAKTRTMGLGAGVATASCVAMPANGTNHSKASSWRCVSATITPTSTSTPPATVKVRTKPKLGTNTCVATKVPSSEPSVEAASTKPPALPAWACVARVHHSTIKGETQPKATIGGKNTKPAVARLPHCNTPSAASRAKFAGRNHCAYQATRCGAAASRRPPAHSARLSTVQGAAPLAQRAPSRYPSDSANNTTPITLVHTIVEAPNQGASKRTAANSPAIVAAPAKNAIDAPSTRTCGRCTPVSPVTCRLPCPSSAGASRTP